MKTVDLFAGAGGMSLGFERAGFNIVGAFEVWEAAAKVHRDNFTHEVYETDLSNVETAAAQIKELSPEAIIGGPPCQDFSDAGNRTEGDRANLTRCYAKIIAKISPPVFVMENVGRAQKSAAYRDAREIFKSCGYGLTEVVLDASLCGAPQKRRRFFCIGIKSGVDGALESTIKGRLSAEPLTVREYMGDEIEIQNYYVHPRTYARRGIFSIDEPAPTMRGQNRPLPGNYKKTPSRRGGAARREGALKWRTRKNTNISARFQVERDKTDGRASYRERRPSKPRGICRTVHFRLSQGGRP